MEERHVKNAINEFLDYLTKMFSSWLSRRLPRVSSDWWKTCVYPFLDIDRRDSINNLDQLDLPKLMIVAERSSNRISDRFNIDKRALREGIKHLRDVRNKWHHQTSLFMKKEEVVDILDVIIEFYTLIDVGPEYINRVEQFKAELVNSEILMDSYTPQESKFAVEIKHGEDNKGQIDYYNHLASICENCSTNDTREEKSESIDEINFNIIRSTTPSLGLSIVASDNNTLEIKGVGDCRDSIIIIPSEYNGKPVKKIADEAFLGCKQIEIVYIPSSVDCIGRFAFCGCSSLTNIAIPQSVKNIGLDAFSQCESLVGVFIEDIATWCSIEFETYFDTDNIIHSNANPLAFAKRLYVNGMLAENIIIPEDVTSIGDWAFVNCVDLKSIVIPTNVTSIGREAFHGCTALTEATIPTGVVSIGKEAFALCSSLKRLDIPNTVTFIGDGAFLGCTGLDSIYYNANSIESEFDETVFALAGRWGSGISLTIGADVTYIPDYLFCSIYDEDEDNDNFIINLTKVTFENGGLCSRIGAFSFSGCAHLIDIDLPNGLTSIGPCAFSGCTSLRRVSLPDSLISIGNFAFRKTAVVSVSIPENVTLIGIGSFVACTSLANIHIPECILSIGEGAFAGCRSLNEIVIPCGINSLSSTIFYGCSSLVKVTLPDSLLEIEDSAFGYCTSLTNVDIPNSVTEIGHEAFIGCSSLLSMEIPKNVVEVGHDAFYGCTSLNCVKIFGEGINLGFQAFCECTSLTSVLLPNDMWDLEQCTFYKCSSLESIVIPDGIKNIGNYAFRDCKRLKSIIISSDVKNIGRGAFEGCTSLENIYFCGDVDECSLNIDIDNGNFTSADMYHYSEEEPEFGVEGLFWCYDDDGHVMIW